MRPNNLPLLLSLWHALLDGLQAALRKPKVAPEMFSVCRAMLRDNHVRATSERSQKALQQMHSMYCTRLAEALSRPKPSAAILAEGRRFLEYQGIRADIPTAQAAQIAKKLGDGSLPFTKPTKPH